MLVEIVSMRVWASDQLDVWQKDYTVAYVRVISVLIQHSVLYTRKSASCTKCHRSRDDLNIQFAWRQTGSYKLLLLVRNLKQTSDTQTLHQE